MKNFLKSLTVILFSALAIGQNFPNISTQTKGQLPINRLNAPGVAGLCLETDGFGNVTLQTCSSGGGSGTVTNFSAGNFAPLFTVSVSNPSTTPSLSFIGSNFAAHTFYGNNTSGSALPGAQTIGLNDLPGLGAATINTSSPLGGGGSLALGSSLTITCVSCITSIPQLPITKSAVASNWINSYNSVTGLFTATQPATSDLSDFPSQATNSGKFLTTNGSTLSWAAVGGSGTVTSFSSGNLSPLFTTSVATATTTPAQSFSLSTAAAHTFLGNNTASTAAPAYVAIGNGDLPGSGGITINTNSPLTGGALVTLGNSLTLSCASCLTSVTAHNLLSATHGDTTTHTVVRGDLIAGIGVSPAWTAVAKGGTNTYPKWNASGDVVASTNPASGTGSPTACTNQAVTAFTLNADAAPTSSCSTITSAFTSGTFPATAHNLLSATHGDTTPGSVVTGDVISGQSSAWARLAGNSTTTPQYLKSLGSGAAATAPSWSQVAYTDLSGVPSTFAPTAHNILSTAHGDTTAASAVRGDGFFAIGVTPTWQRLAHPATTGGYFKWNGTDIVASSLAASGTGNCAANQFETGSNADAAPTCAQPSFTNLSGSVAAAQMPALTGDITSTAGTVATTLATVATPGTSTKITFNAKGLVTSGTSAVLASADFANQGTTTTLLHGNAAGNPSFAGVNLINDASANQGTVNQLLHGNAAGQPSFSAVASADLNLTTTTCTNQFVTAISAGGVGTCTTDTLASAQHANQGTATTVLHGNAAGNPAFGAVVQGDVTNGYVDLSSTQASIGGAKTFTGVVTADTPKSIGKVLYAAQFAGSSTTCGILEAYNALPAAGGKIILQQGNCSASGWPVTISKSVVIEGQGMGGPIDAGFNSNVQSGSSLTNTSTGGSFFVITIPGTTGISAEGMTFRDFAMIGNKTVGGATAGDCVDMLGGTATEQIRAIRFDNIQCNQPKGFGFLIQDNAFIITFINTHVDQSGNHCFVIQDGPNAGVVSQIHIIASVFDLCGGSNASFLPGTADAIHISGVNNRAVEVTDSTMADSNNGIFVVAGAINASVHVTNSDFETNTTCDISLNDGLDHRITSSTLFGTGTGARGVCTAMPVGATVQLLQLFMDGNWFGSHTVQDVTIGANQKTCFILPQMANNYTYTDNSGHCVRLDVNQFGILNFTAAEVEPAANNTTALGDSAAAWSNIFTFGVSTTEGTALSGVAGKDICYGDSTAHAIECNYNNTGFSGVPLVGNAQTWTGIQTFAQANKLGQADIVADSAGINTTETIVVKTPALAANRLIAGTHIRMTLNGTCTSTAANTSTFTVRMGTAGTTADTAVATSTTAVAATTGTNIPFKTVIDFTVRTVGASGTGFITLELANQGATGIATTTEQLIMPTMSTFNTTTASNILSVSYKSAASTTTSTFKQGVIEIIQN